MTRFRILLGAIALAWATFLLSGCAVETYDAAWKRVPPNCHMEYDAQGRGVASYCAVP